MPRTTDDARRWMGEGTKMFMHAVTALADSELDDPSDLPDWSRRTLIAHVAANADAIGNLVRWAATGVETPMYESPEARVAGIDRASRLPSKELRALVERSASRLHEAMDALDEAQWDSSVVTAQGRTVQATETPWMRAREVMVHSVDLASGVGFRDLPSDFLTALRADILGKRGDVPEVVGGLADITAWLAGRPYADVTTPDGQPAPTLDPWL